MNPLTTIAQSDWLRLIFGGIITGAAIYGLTHPYPQVAWIAVPIAGLNGAISCFICEHMVEAIFKAVIAAIIVFFAIRITPQIIAKNPTWWKVALVSFPIGLLGGLGIGSLLGGVCRLFWVPPIHDQNSNQKS